ncbi:TlpA family protein disulfide reductase [Odoribacter splanchnicus]|uniref:TlpA family protein disulfide reductase n=2 Tax=Odoribacter TaxID=283168 RepID=A0A412TRG5_9BACT|nr:TlpA disulfide reductase family protein [Odoribacter splanchnicus]MDB9211008.1 TlpA disulfide reductase family protein [Odoribacter splanchnicus]MDB9226717.1 TlpA disulfide reductase family protein [Odoribacter splanchnicus]MDB9237449.1 TlpA disulfide reductase family protein [Odoribacter splanchnicus]MDB9241250.1 TlpA disulfide reductase family protein [Odoribacter splanchnicus]MDB9246194.1 TlpA disulfide reductase family protein [Odoribacter splanchnicus]
MRFGCLILLMFVVLACGQEKKKETVNPLAYAVITGHIKNRQVYPQQSALKVIIPSYWNAQTIQECAIRPDHTFTFRFQPLALRDISIETFIPYLLIRPGDSLHIELDFAKLNKVEFSGTAGKLNQDLYAYTDGEGYYLEQRAGTDDQKLPVAAFRKKMDNEREVRLQRILRFAKKYQIGKDLQKWIMKGLEAEYYDLLLEYGSLHSLLTGDTVPAGFFNFDAALENLFTGEVIHSRLFELAAKFRTRPGLIKDTLQNSTEILMRTASSTKNKVLSQFMVASLFDTHLGFNDVTFFEENRDFFDGHVTLPILREPLLRKYETKKAYLNNPKPVSDAMLYGVTPENGKMIIAGEGMRKLQQVIQANKGKVILINFWGGCPAAIDNLSILNDLSEIYKNDEVAFVSIADDDPIIRKWADDYDLKGQKYFWPDPDTREIMKNWHIFWSPYYLLIDKEGVIVDYGSHILPRMDRTREKIDCLLEE